MKLTNETLAVLKNFANINPGIEFKKGKSLTTISSTKTVLAKASVKDEFTDDFCIYDLNQFLSVNSLFKDSAELDFDAANVIKHNNDLLYLVSNTGNLDGAKWLENYCKETFGEEYKVHTAENVYAYIHIDTTFVFLREGLVLLNPSRVNWRNLPELLSRFDRVWAPEPYPTQVMNDWCPASPWLGMNILPINSELVMVEEHQVLLMKELKKWGIESIPVKLRHARTLSGGPHCVTLDVVRDAN
jgi:hypothetical protein